MQEYLGVRIGAALVKAIAAGRSGVRPEVTATSFSPTLAWYIAWAFTTDLHWQTAQGIRLRDLAGNDYDYHVLAFRGSGGAVLAPGRGAGAMAPRPGWRRPGK
jgi:hypothetical protein